MERRHRERAGVVTGYGSLASTQAVLRFLSKHLLPKPQDPFDIPELNLRPVATPRAPVAPDPAPAVSPSSTQASLPAPVTPGSVSVAQVYTPVRSCFLTGSQSVISPEHTKSLKTAQASTAGSCP